jgi:hypothetical protein
MTHLLAVHMKHAVLHIHALRYELVTVLQSKGLVHVNTAP